MTSCPRCRWMPLPYGVFLCAACARWARDAETAAQPPRLRDPERDALDLRHRLAIR